MLKNVKILLDKISFFIYNKFEVEEKIYPEMAIT